jgi:3-isopropylmalate/(R)-2-methylmalate dehydratase small subunit
VRIHDEPELQRPYGQRGDGSFDEPGFRGRQWDCRASYRSPRIPGKEIKYHRRDAEGAEAHGALEISYVLCLKMSKVVFCGSNTVLFQRSITGNVKPGTGNGYIYRGLEMKTFKGPVLFLDRSDINTDEIIPAKYLTEIDKESLKPHLLEDLKLEGFSNQGEEFEKARIVVARKNFGCGSSREHAPWALEINGIHTVIAESFARIFRQNMFNGGMLAIELDKKTIDSIFALGKGTAVSCTADVEHQKLSFRSGKGKRMTVQFSVMEFDRQLVQAGGWVDFADKTY